MKHLVETSPQAATETAAPCETALDGLSPAERRAQWMKYMRTFEPAQQRPGKTEKVPDEILMQMAADSDRSRWFPIWVENGSSWAKVKMSLEKTNSQVEKESEVDMWLTQGQIIDLYKDEAVGKAIVAKKRGIPGCSRPHPDVPDMIEALQYVVRVRSSKAVEFLKTNTQSLGLQGDVTGAGAAIMQGQLGTSQMLATAGIATGAAAAGSGTTHEPSAGPASAAAEAKAAKAAAAEAAKLERKREQELRKAEAAEEKRRRVEEKKQAKEDFKASPAGKAMEWLDKLAADLNLCAETRQTDTSMMRAAIAQEWQNLFNDHHGTFVGLQGKLGSMRDGHSDDTSCFSEVSAAVTDFKTDVKTFQSQLNMVRRLKPR